MARTSKNLKALKRTAIITIHDGPKDGPDAAPAIDLELRKHGGLALTDEVFQVPLLGEALEHLVNGTVAGFKKSGLQAGNSEQMKVAGEAIMEAIRKAANDEGTPLGRAVRTFATKLPKTIENIIVNDVILEDESEREDLRELVRSFGATALINLAVGWVEFNLPEWRDFLVQKLREALSRTPRQTAPKSSATDTAAPAADGEIAVPDPLPQRDEGESSLAA